LPPGYESIRGTARVLGCAHVTLIDAMDDGRIPETAIVRDPSGKRIGLQVEVVRASMAANTDPLQSARKGLNWTAPPGAPVADLVVASTLPRADEADPTIQEARADKERAAAAMAQLQLAEKLGQVVMADGVSKAASTAAKATRDAVLAIPDRCASLVAAETDVARVHAILSNEIRQALNGLADRLSAGAG
jgi:hypothetical protein